MSRTFIVTETIKRTFRVRMSDEYIERVSRASRANGEESVESEIRCCACDLASEPRAESLSKDTTVWFLEKEETSEATEEK